jgi:hypothetical protein
MNISIEILRSIQCKLKSLSTIIWENYCSHSDDKSKSNTIDFLNKFEVSTFEHFIRE